MKTKLGILVNDGFRYAFNSLISKELSAINSFKIAKVLREIKQIYTDYETARQKLLDTYAKKDSTGQFVLQGQEYTFETENKILFQEDLIKLWDVEVEHSQTDFSALTGLSIAPEILDVLVGVVIDQPVEI